MIGMDPYQIAKDFVNYLYKLKKKKMPFKQFERYLKNKVNSQTKINLSKNSLEDYIYSLESDGKIRIVTSETGQKYVIIEDSF